jgi:hypothetical protein
MQLTKIIVYFTVSLILTSSVFASGFQSGNYNSIKWAAGEGKSTKVKNFLDLDDGTIKNSLNEKDKYWQRELLEKAVSSGDIGTVQVLLDFGLDINSYGQTTSENLVTFAFRHVNPSYGASFVTVENKNVSERAALKGKAKRSTEKKVDNATDKGIVMIDFLISKGLDISKFNNVVNTAAYEGYPGLIKYFNQKGISINEPVKYHSCRTNVLMQIIKKSSNSIQPGLKSAVEYLVEKSPSFINEPEIECTKGTALMAAYDTKDVELVKFLVSKGAKNIKDRNGRTPLDYAVGADKEKMIEVLKKAR